MHITLFDSWANVTRTGMKIRQVKLEALGYVLIPRSFFILNISNLLNVFMWYGLLPMIPAGLISPYPRSFFIALSLQVLCKIEKYQQLLQQRWMRSRLLSIAGTVLNFGREWSQVGIGKIGEALVLRSFDVYREYLCVTPFSQNTIGLISKDERRCH